jgi:tetratricopeptide (TPR) repeat protein
VNLHHPLIRRIARGSLFAAVGLALLAAPAARVSAQSESAPTERPKQLTDEAQAVFNKVWPLIEAKNWEQAIPLLNEILSKAKPDSYDTATASVILSQVYLQRNTPGGSDYAAAIPLLENVIRLNYHEQAKILDFTFLLAQLHNMGGNTARAEELAMRWLDTAPKWKIENVVFVTSIKLQRAQAKDGKIDKDAVTSASEIIKKAMLIFPNPTEQLYQIQAISYQLNNDYEKAAEIFEILVAKWPKNRQYWQQLYALYVNSNLNLRAILTLERAQELGILNTTKDHLSRVGLYYNLQRFDRVCVILDQGLKDGTIDSEANNYELLAAAYQQTFQEFKAIDTYRRAIEKFPKLAGKYYISITNLYWEMQKYAEALESIEKGLAAGDVENPGKLYMFAAYICYELRKYDKGLDLLAKAKPLLADTPQARQEFEGLTNSIKDAIERDQKQAAAAANPKK